MNSETPRNPDMAPNQLPCGQADRAGRADRRGNCLPSSSATISITAEATTDTISPIYLRFASAANRITAASIKMVAAIRGIGLTVLPPAPP